MTNSLCVDFKVDTTWGMPRTFSEPSATLNIESIIGRLSTPAIIIGQFTASFVCTISGPTK